MAKRRETQDDLQKTKRISPYHEMDEAYENEAEYDSPDAYEDAYVDAYDEADAYDEEYLEEGEEEVSGARGGFFSTVVGKVAAAVIALLLVVLLALLAVRFLRKPADSQTLPQSKQTAVPAQQSTASAPIIFAPVEQATAVPTQEPTAKPTATPSAEPTSTPLPIILTNTPTPTPTATPTPTPTATPEPTATPTPEPTAVPEIGRGEVNRDANLRESAASNGKVKQTVKKGEAVTIHDSLKDKSGKVWYQLTVDDQAVTGFMRDYVVDLAGKLNKIEIEEVIEATPEPEKAEPVEQGTEKTESVEDEPEKIEPEKDEPAAEAEEPEADAVEAEEAIATGETNRDANLRKSMNGSVLATVKEGKSVSIHEVLLDKSKNTWYRLSVDGSDQSGYMRDFVIDLDGDTELKYESAVEKASVGTARTNRQANVRKAPDSGAGVVRQISKNVKLHILGKYQDDHNQVWYQISTETGNTTGFMRDYVLDSVKLDDGVETQTYSE